MGRREAGQHRPAPPRQARQPLILCPKGTRVSPAMGPLGGYRWELPHRGRRENPGPQPRSKKIPHRPPATQRHGAASKGPAPTPPVWPDRITSRPPGSAAAPPAHSRGDPVAEPVADFCSAALCKSLPQRGPFPAILLAGPTADARTPRETPPASAGPHRGLLVPQHKEGPPSKGSLKPGQQGGGGCSLAPGAHAMWTLGRGGQQPRSSS